MKLEELKEEKATAEITANPSKEELNRAWPHNSLYKGQPYFDAYIDTWDNPSSYVPVVKFEVDQDLNPHNMKALNIELLDDEDDDEDRRNPYFVGMYEKGGAAGPYKQLHDEYPDLIDLRLD